MNQSNKEFTCFPAVPTITKKTGMSERTVQRALKELCEEGYIKKSQRYRENGGQSSNLYTLIEDLNSTTDDAISNIENHEKMKCEVKCKSLEIDYYQRKMRIIDFSFFSSTLINSPCHRVGDRYAPP